MKFIGQFIQHFISRFKNDVFLENISSGTIASGGNLGLDSNNKIVKATSTSHDEVTLAGTPDYITISGQEITRNAIDLANDVTGTLAAGNVATLNQDTTGSAATLTTARAFQTDLASTSSANFDGSAANTHGVTGTLPLGNGGTGQTTAQAALDALAGGTTAGRYLRGDGSNIVLGAIQTSHVPTLNQDTTGSAATLTTPRAINGVNFDGSAAITIPTRVHGSTIKVLPTDFIPNEDGGTSKGVFLDDDGTTGLKAGIAQMELIAVVIIPENYKATHVDIFDNSHNLVVNVFEMNVNASGQTSKGSGNANTTIDITDVNATATNYLAIEVVTTATSERVFGGTVTIAPQ